MDTFNLPDDLSASSLDEIATLEAAAVAAFDALFADLDTLDNDGVAELERLGDAVTTLRAEATNRQAASTARRDRAAAAAARIAPPPAAEVVVTAAEVEPEPATEVVEPVVVAAGTTVSVRDVVRKPPSLPRRSGDSIVITAAADVPGFVAGGTLENGLADVAAAFAARTRSFPKAAPRDGSRVRQQYGVATFSLGFTPEQMTHNTEADYDVIMAAGREANLPGGSLIAAGGWCAPSETFYDLCSYETLDGLIDIPEVGVSRGGIRFTRGPSFADIYASAGFCQTEAEAIAGEEKDCAEIECPEFEEVRLDACGLCIQAPLLTNAGYPELVQRWISGSLIAHQHKMSAKVINRMAEIAGTPTVITGGAGTAFDVLTALEWSAETQRYRYRLAFNETLEAVAPRWLLPQLRADLALRSGRPAIDVTDAEIASHFAARGVRIQWVYDWQPLNVLDDDTPATGSNCFAPIPATVDVLLYPAGTFVKGTADVISLDAVYDSTLLKQNMYTALFVEEGILVANRCMDACALTIPICASGLTGGTLEGCWNAAVTP